MLDAGGPAMQVGIVGQAKELLCLLSLQCNHLVLKKLALEGSLMFVFQTLHFHALKGSESQKRVGVGGD